MDLSRMVDGVCRMCGTKRRFVDGTPELAVGGCSRCAEPCVECETWLGVQLERVRIEATMDPLFEDET